MTVEQAQSLCDELRGRFDSPFSTLDKQTIERLYSEVLGKRFKPTTCQQCYHDGLIEIYLYLKQNNKMADKKNYILRAGAIIHCPDFHKGKAFNNNNITDEIAAEYLEKYPNKAVLFAQIPSKPVEVVNTTPKKRKPRKSKKTEE